MDWTDSKREKKPRNYCRRGERWPKASCMKTMLDSAIAAMCRLSPASASNGSCVIQERKRRWLWYVIISSACFPRIGKKFTLNGWRIFAIGASAGKCGGDIGYRRGMRNPKLQIPNPKSTLASRRRLIRRIGSRIPIHSIHGFHRGYGLTKPWMTRRGRNFIRPACW